ncbi:putative Isochorismatase family hydrolase [Taphrina deformans PYCC 5710]|uniref:Isochorismatase family hydrolase n=1 Tax=Taphrina deformans (strain PYCC 5710 / ATCC 11124 / CBS 356.35 / IMI 108563 / JCM 9778 / NBRC 8474) TaxID=1097556 RepID=R4X9A5_TAPDE|nr:putative Isochorismatase family hydrolase [Taphrina deformans PYCC 5710]|eukprot:CCG80767.1 putative Isochorismatase family hydrolase [Taphrina deformans PYCC 5710]
MKNPALFVCDIQTKFEKAIHAWPHVVSTSRKLLSASTILSIPVYYTTQLREKLGDTVPSLVVRDPALDIDKSLFSMCTPELLQSLPPGSDVAIVGIEAHICVTQTTLDLLQHGHRVYIVADGVSSCNAAEVPIALRRLAGAGATVTTSESFIYQVTRDAKVDNFKAIAQLVKESKESTRAALENMPGCK